MKYEASSNPASKTEGARKASRPAVTRSTALKIVEFTGDLPAMPHIAAQVMDKLSNPNATPRDIHQLLTQDQGLAARVLKVANSPYYGASRSIASLRDAVLFMGFDSIKSLVMTAVLKGMFPSMGLAEKLLWEHSIGCGVAARQVGSAVGFSRTDEAFLAGLLHDIGKSVLFLRAPSVMRDIMQDVYNSGSNFVEIEQQAIGFTHVEVGRLMADKWHFALNIEDAIANHHQPDQSQSTAQLAHIVCLGNSLCHKLEIGPTRKPESNPADTPSAKALSLGPISLSEIMNEITSALKDQENAA